MLHVHKTTDAEKQIYAALSLLLPVLLHLYKHNVSESI